MNKEFAAAQKLANDAVAKSEADIAAGAFDSLKILAGDNLALQGAIGIAEVVVNTIRAVSGLTAAAAAIPSPVRADTSNAIIELLAITRWGNLDYLIVDMPPGIGDATLDMIRLIERIRFLVVCTPSKVAYETVRKQIKLLHELNIPTIGIVENMVMKPTKYVSERAKEDNTAYLGAINYDPTLEDALGDVELLKKTEFYDSIIILTDKVD